MAVLLFLIISILFGFSESVSSLSRGDAMPLRDFKNSVSFDPSNILSTWNASSNHCYWYGITCDELSGRVISINITGKMNSRSPVLTGTLPDSIGNLTELRILSIPYNVFSGEVPEEIGKLRSLEVLELQGNNFSGRIPEQLRYLSSLHLLNLSHNMFSDSIPHRFIGFSDIRVIDLSYNQLSGEFKIDALSRCENLIHLKLSNNFLIGKIPKEISKCRNLMSLLIDGNIFEGRIPVRIGLLWDLRILDVSRNSLTGRIPKELSGCRNLSVIVLTNLDDSYDDVRRGEYNAFIGGIPYEVFSLPNLEVLWAPRSNIGGRLPSNWSESCSLRAVNLGQNYLSGLVSESMGLCKKLTFLDLSSNNLLGYLPSHLQVPCMVYLNVSRNSFYGALPRFVEGSCDDSIGSYVQDSKIIHMGDFQNTYWVLNRMFQLWLKEELVVAHDFSWNSFSSSVPMFSIGDQFLQNNQNYSYRLLLNNNHFNGSLPREFISNCSDLQSFSVNFSTNRISGMLYDGLFSDCSQLKEFEAADNQIGGSIGIEGSTMLQRLDLRGNRLSGSLPDQLGKLKNLKWVLLGENNLTGYIPPQICQLRPLMVLDLSQNALIGSIPSCLTNATNLEIVLLDHNQLIGEIPSSFSVLSSLTKLDVSFNNLSGHIPHLQHPSNCDGFRGNRYLHSCPDAYPAPPTTLPVPLEVRQWHTPSKMKSFLIAIVTSASVVVCVLVVLVLVLLLGRRKLGRLSSLRRKELVTFAASPTELNYNNVVRATGNFSLRNLIGTGGFGSTYKAEMVPGFLVAVKRLSIGRFQGFQQFEAEIRTLGRIQHKNLVTLIGYYMGETEMFLIYNYLSGGNLETFIHDRLGQNAKWPIIQKVAVDIAEALVYLHYSCVPRIVHRDIKPSNILLDEKLNAYLSDFGLARLIEVSETHATTDVAGTFGYVAPEYATTCRVSDKADVYSYGVVLLELMSGKKSLDPSFSEYRNGFNIVTWAKFLFMEERFSELFSPELWELGPKENLLGMLSLASACTVESLSVRPSMQQVLEKLRKLS